jgi:hypothetical protein
VGQDDLNVEDVIDNSPIPECDGISRDEWKGLMVEAMHSNGRKFADVLVSATNPILSVDGEDELGNINFGVVVCAIFDGDSALRNMCISWPIRSLFLKSVSVYDHLRKHAHIVHEDEMRKLDRKGKRRYDTSNRVHKTKKTQDWRISEDEIAKVYMGECCDRHCIRMFPPSIIRVARQEMFLRDTQERRSKNLDIHRTKFRSVDGNEDLVMFQFKEVCVKGWKLIHGVSNRTFRRYEKQAKEGARARPHGNTGKSKPRASTAHAAFVLESMIANLADQMPYPCTLPSGKRVAQKILPTGIRWNQFLPRVNEVCITCMFQKTTLVIYSANQPSSIFIDSISAKLFVGEY